MPRTTTCRSLEQKDVAYRVTRLGMKDLSAPLKERARGTCLSRTRYGKQQRAAAAHKGRHEVVIWRSFSDQLAGMYCQFEHQGIHLQEATTVP